MTRFFYVFAFISFWGQAVCADPFPAFKTIKPNEHSLSLLEDNSNEQIFNQEKNNQKLQSAVSAIFNNEPLKSAAKQNRLTFAILHYPEGSLNPSYAAINPKVELYAASIAKIAILLGFLNVSSHIENKTEQDLLLLKYEKSLREMIRVSSNVDASIMYHAAKFENIKEALFAHKLFDWNGNAKNSTGGLWIGKPYEPGIQNNRKLDERLFQQLRNNMKERHPSPVSQQIHASNALQAVRYLWLLERGQLVNPYFSQIIKAFLFKPNSFCAEEIAKQIPDAKFYSKTGTYNQMIGEVLEVSWGEQRFFMSLIMQNVPDQLKEIKTICSKVTALILK